MDFYEIFEVSRDATHDDIEKQYRKLAKLHHPDRNGGDEVSLEKFKEMQAAYDIIGNPDKRRSYDSKFFQKKRLSSDFDDRFFSTFFGSDNRGRNIQVRLEIEINQLLKESIHTINYSKRNLCKVCRGSGLSSFKNCPKCLGSGQTINVNQIGSSPCGNCQGQGITHSVRCSDCDGTGYGIVKNCKLEVKIPPGIDHGMQVRICNEGEDGSDGQPTGDLYVTVLLKDHEFFKRENFDLLVDVPVNYSTLIIGGEILIPTLEGVYVKVKVPVSTPSDTRFRLKGRGIPKYDGKSGDILATIKLEVPIAISDQYKELLAKLKTMEEIEISPKVKSYKNRVK